MLRKFHLKTPLVSLLPRPDDLGGHDGLSGLLHRAREVEHLVGGGLHGAAVLHHHDVRLGRAELKIQTE